jgi:hypothetical protein
MTPFEETRAAAERVLSDAWRGAVKLEGDEGLGGSNRSNVYRFSVKEGPENGSESVVVKRAAGVGQESYDPGATQGPAWRLFNDWAGLQFLTEVAGANSPAPRFYGGSREVGLVVIEDLGRGSRLDHFLLGEDAEAAERGLMNLVTALGRMHAMTVGKRAMFDRIRDSLGPREAGQDPGDAVQRQRQKLQKLADSVGLAIHPEVEVELKSLEGFLDENGPFQAYSHHDPCPDNCLWVGQEMKLLDFEFGDFRHALLDGVYGRIHFPTCWCVNRLPERVYVRMEQVYRNELVRGCPEAQDNEVFSRAVVEACAWQLLNSLFLRVLEEDGQWGIATHRQRALVRLDRFAEMAETFGHLEALGITAREMAGALRGRWPKEADEMPLYPAFRK